MFARIRKERCKLLFDTGGADREEMGEEARLLYKQIQKVGKKASSAEEASSTIDVVVNNPAEREGKEAASEGGAAHASHAAPPTAGKPFRVMIGGQVRGPYSLAELRGLLSSGKIGGDALIGVESWLPAATLGGMLGSHVAGAAAGSAKAGAGEHDGEEVEDLEEEFGDFEEVEAEDETPPPPSNDGDAIPVDEEFQL